MKKFIYPGLLCLSVIAALVSGILFFVVSTTGYLTGSTFNFAVGILLIVAAVLIAGSSLSKWVGGKLAIVLQLVAAVVLALALAFFIHDKADFIGDSFIPMQRADAFYGALGVTYSSIVFLVISVIALAVAGFIGQPEEAK